MEKTIDLFAKEVSDYVNRHIVGHENTHIKKCIVQDNARNRGKGICMCLIMPPDAGYEEDCDMGPVFYAEELLAEFTSHTAAFVAEVLNGRVNEMYDAFLNVCRTQKTAMKKTINEYEPKDLILTSLPVGVCGKSELSHSVSKRREDLGLDLIIKGRLCDSPEEGHVYYTPVVKDKTCNVSDECWEMAAKNSFDLANIVEELVPVCGPTPLFGSLVDAFGVYDHFYLLSLKETWEPIRDKYKAEKVYLIPNGPYSVLFLIAGNIIENDRDAKCVFDNLLKGARNIADDGSLFVVDLKTFEISKITEGR